MCWYRGDFAHPLPPLRPDTPGLGAWCRAPHPDFGGCGLCNTCLYLASPPCAGTADAPCGICAECWHEGIWTPPPRPFVAPVVDDDEDNDTDVDNDTAKDDAAPEDDPEYDEIDTAEPEAEDEPIVPPADDNDEQSDPGKDSEDDDEKDGEGKDDDGKGSKDDNDKGNKDDDDDDDDEDYD